MEESTSELTAPVKAMFDRILAVQDAFFKSQQRGDPDLTLEQKLEIIDDLYRNNVAQFVYRYHGYLNVEDLNNFAHCSQDYEVQFYLKDLKNRASSFQPLSEPGTSSDTNAVKSEPSELPKTNENGVKSRLEVLKKRRKRLHSDRTTKNRRYAALRKLIKDDNEYFSDWEMRKRDPLLYDEMIGRYLNEQEQRDLLHSGKHDGSTMSGMFMDFHDSKLTADLKRTQRMERQMERLMGVRADDSDDSFDSDRESEVEEVGDDDEPIVSSSSEFEPEYDSDDEAHRKKSLHVKRTKSQKSTTSTRHMNRPITTGATALDPQSRAQLRTEFVSVMHQRFLAGHDAQHFDYSTVDDNADYDPMDLIERDQQDAYFDAEQPS